MPGAPWTARPRALADAHIEMIGVWDTVGAMGIPGAVFGNQDAEEYRFRNKALHPDVRAGYHAIAIDERRRQFKPTLWDAPAPNQIIEQVWFAGVHGDVGGGKRVRRSSLSEITLAWMVDKAVAHRIQLSSEADYPHLLMSKASADCPMRTSWRPYRGRPAHRSIPQGATIANSVAARMSANRRYRPEMLIDPMTRTLGRGYPLADVVAISPTTSIPLTPDLERTAS
ncbi:DUF2235 domain-containing protein [Gordonia sp. CPCC 205515]|uniref:phospholipase effector Tle1 domain-containing protein n=1 Tax=Gordonia sp. CPCC 205515 TaxID=3140791 RepID=UPI003AF36BCB